MSEIAPNAAANALPSGLTSDEARRRLIAFGLNATPDAAPATLRRAAGVFWARFPGCWKRRSPCSSRSARRGPGLGGRRASGFQRARRVLPGEPRSGDAAGAEIAPRPGRLGQARRRIWSSRPSLAFMLSSLVDVALFATPANEGILMAPLPLSVIAGLMASAIRFALALDEAEAAAGRLLKTA